MADLAIRPAVAAVELEAALAELRPDLVRRLTLVVGDRDEAEDLAQEACLRALQQHQRFDGRNLRGWLHVIGVRLALNELRRRRRALAAIAYGSRILDGVCIHECLRIHDEASISATLLGIQVQCTRHK